jgi:signal transduction histidine kinase
MGVLAGDRGEFSMDFSCDGPQQQDSAWFRMRVTPIRWKGAHAALVMHLDVTREVSALDEAVRLTVELERRVQRRTRQLQAINRELEAFSFSVSHDLKSPLAAMDSITYVLAESLKGRLQSSEQFYMERIRSGCAEMTSLIDAMLGLHRVSHDLPLTLSNADLSQIAEGIAEELREEDPARPALVRIDPSMSVDCDPALMAIALRNLIGNAWKFSAKKALTHIEVRIDERTESHVLLRVSDQGAGFDPRYADRLFAPFGRLHHSTDFPGTGIGLATVERIVRRHSGSIRAESRPGEGATFWIMLPQGASFLETGR